MNILTRFFILVGVLIDHPGREHRPNGPTTRTRARRER